jgi:hypothetical protein
MLAPANLRAAKRTPGLPNPATRRLPPAHVGVKSHHISPTQKHFLLNRAASKKQIPIN